MTFHFVRHGETNWNAEGRFQGQNDVPLNEIGRKQALEASKRMGGLNFDVIFSSPLSRAAETATIFAQQMKNPPEIVMLPGLAECGSEVTARLIYAGLGRTQYPSFSSVPENLETPEQFASRVRDAIQLVFQNKCLSLIVAHGGVYWAICQILEIKPGDIPNCLPIAFEQVDGKWVQNALWI